MNLQALGTALEAIGMEMDAVVLGGWDEQCWCIHESETGEWLVYWRERGQQNRLTVLPNENAACELLLGKLTYSKLIAGALVKRT